jgi:ketosteroid isomerase-like protein
MGPNLELVREALSAYLSGDRERALELAHPDMVSYRAPPLPDPQTYHGHEGVDQMLADWTAEFGEFEMEVVEYTELGDRVLVEMLQRGTGRASGAAVSGRFWFLFTIAEGKIARQDVYSTSEQALEAAGG